MKEIEKTKPILVTGATGYIASWIVKFLLDEGCTVHGTVRDKSNIAKHQHLLDIAQKSPGKLLLFEADLNKEGSFWESMQGCELVIHTASPFFVSNIKDAEKDLINPAKNGTKTVLESVNQTDTVKRVVLTSSMAAMYGDVMDIRESKDQTLSEEDWNTTSSVKHQPYSYSKTIAERTAWEMVEKQNRWDLVVINPGFVFGPSLSTRKDSTSIDMIISLANGKYKSGLPGLTFGIVDVRDVAKAHLKAGFLPQAKGRHLTVEGVYSLLDVANMLREKYKDTYKFPKKEIPKFLVYIFGPLQGFSWKFIKRNIGISMKMNNTYVQKDLDMRFRDIKTSVQEHLAQIIEDKLI